MNALKPTVLAIALLLPGAAALAQRPAPPSFESLDTNHDGVLSKDEVHAMFAHFGRGGAHHGGTGNAEGPEGGGFGGHHGGGFGGNADDSGRPRGRRPDPDAIFASWDKDGNGTISKAEFDARPRFGRGPGAAPPPRDAQDLPQN